MIVIAISREAREMSISTCSWEQTTWKVGEERVRAQSGDGQMTESHTVGTLAEVRIGKVSPRRHPHRRPASS